MTIKYKHPKLPELVRTYKPGLIVEFGSWYGDSAAAMASAAEEAGIETHIYCIDTWLGSIENWTRPSGRKGGVDALMLDKDGRPQFFRAFMNTLEVRGLKKYVTPLSMPVETGTKYLLHQWNGLGEAELVYVDASHEFEDVRADIARAFKLTGGKDAIVCGDDYKNKPGVTQAVDLILGDNFQLAGHFWWTEV